MQKRTKLSRNILIVGVVGALAATLTMLLLPQPHRVDLGLVERGDLTVTIVEEGRTNVRETYIVSTPVAGRLMRVQLHPGDAVAHEDTVVARMLPTNPTVLDSRTREQAAAAVEAAIASVRLAQATLDAALADEELAQSELDRTLALFESDIVSRSALDRAASAFRASSASRETAEATISIREAELANARAQLIGRDDRGQPENGSQSIPLYSPIDGWILQVFQESETVLPAGAPIMEIGDVLSDLEVTVDLISSDAVKVTVGDRVILRDWGQQNDLAGEVVRIDPFGVTKTSALGIEEQRVRVEIALLSPAEDRPGLGHGYRLEAGIVVWQATDVMLVPTSALFRTNGEWMVFRSMDGVAQTTRVEIGQSDGVSTEVQSGLDAGDFVILFPSAAIEDQSKITPREE